MFKSFIPVSLLLCVLFPGFAQKGNHQNPADIQKIQAFQKSINAKGKNMQVIHPSKSVGTQQMHVKKDTSTLKSSTNKSKQKKELNKI